MAQAKEKSFEASLKRLDEIVHMLESGEAPLAKSLALFEEGVGLVKDCTSQLDKAQAQIKILCTGADGTVSEKDFDPEQYKTTGKQ